MTKQEKAQRDRVIEAVFPVIADRMGWHHRIDDHPPRNTNFACDVADAAITAMQKNAAMDRLVAEGQRCDAMTPQEAARVLLDACPNPIFDTLKPKLMGEFSQPYPFFDENGEEVTANVNISWTVTKDIIAAALRAISEDSHE